MKYLMFITIFSILVWGTTNTTTSTTSSTNANTLKLDEKTQLPLLCPPFLLQKNMTVVGSMYNKGVLGIQLKTKKKKDDVFNAYIDACTEHKITVLEKKIDPDANTIKLKYKKQFIYLTIVDVKRYSIVAVTIK